MKRHLLSLFQAMALVAAGLSGLAHSQDYPTHPIRVITTDAGSGPDFVARLIAYSLVAPLGQQVIVENRGGGNGVVAAQAVQKATPDGYTILLYGNGFWTFPLIEKTPYDVIRDFAPITMASVATNMIVVNPALLPVSSIQELIAAAKARPGQLNYATGGVGSQNYVAAEMFKSMAGLQMVGINYKSAGDSVTGLLSGQVQIAFGSGTTFTPLLKSGRVKALAVTTAKPSTIYPNLPTVASAGLDGYDSATSLGMWTTAAVPNAIVAKLNQEIVKVLKQPDVKAKLFETGAEPIGSTPQELTAAMRSEMTRVGKLLEDLGIKAK